MTYAERIKHNGLAVNNHGIKVSTVEQSGEWSGEFLGRLWIQFPVKGASRWFYIGLASTRKATQHAIELENKTEAEIRELYDL